MVKSKLFKSKPDKAAQLLLDKNAEALEKFKNLWAADDEKKVILVKFEDIVKVPFFETYEIAKGWTSWRIPNNDDAVVLFFCHVKANETLIMHEHDCWEKFIVVEGAIKGYDKMCRFKPFTPHKVTADEDTILIVKFSRKYIK